MRHPEAGQAAPFERAQGRDDTFTANTKMVDLAQALHQTEANRVPGVGGDRRGALARIVFRPEDHDAVFVSQICTLAASRATQARVPLKLDRIVLDRRIGDVVDDSDGGLRPVGMVADRAVVLKVDAFVR